MRQIWYFPIFLSKLIMIIFAIIAGCKTPNESHIQSTNPMRLKLREILQASVPNFRGILAKRNCKEDLEERLDELENSDDSKYANGIVNTRFSSDQISKICELYAKDCASLGNCDLDGRNRVTLCAGDSLYFKHDLELKEMVKLCNGLVKKCSPVGGVGVKKCHYFSFKQFAHNFKDECISENDSGRNECLVETAKCFIDNGYCVMDECIEKKYEGCKDIKWVTQCRETLGLNPDIFTISNLFEIPTPCMKIYNQCGATNLECKKKLMSETKVMLEANSDLWHLAETCIESYDVNGNLSVKENQQQCIIERSCGSSLEDNSQDNWCFEGLNKYLPYYILLAFVYKNGGTEDQYLDELIDMIGDAPDSVDAAKAKVNELGVIDFQRLVAIFAIEVNICRKRKGEKPVTDLIDAQDCVKTLFEVFDMEFDLSTN